MDYAKRAKQYSKEYILKQIQDCEIELKEPCHSANDRFIHNNLRAWLEYYTRLLKEKEKEIKK